MAQTPAIAHHAPNSVRPHDRSDHMTDPTIPVLGLAVIDSLNPSALAMTLWLLSRPGAVPRVIAYVGGILAAYLLLGIALMLGLGAAMRAFGEVFDHPVALAIQFAIGLVLLLYSVFAPKVGAAPVEPPPPKVGGLVGMVLLGMFITAAELVTALPYFAATTLMTFTRLPAVQWLPLLLVYNAIFVAPPLLLLGLHVLLGRHLGDRYPRWRMTMQRGAREATLWIVAIVGVALLGDAIGRYLGKRGDEVHVQATILEIEFPLWVVPARTQSAFGARRIPGSPLIAPDPATAGELTRRRSGLRPRAMSPPVGALAPCAGRRSAAEAQAPRVERSVRDGLGKSHLPVPSRTERMPPR